MCLHICWVLEAAVLRLNLLPSVRALCIVSQLGPSGALSPQFADIANRVDTGDPR